MFGTRCVYSGSEIKTVDFILCNIVHAMKYQLCVFRDSILRFAFKTGMSIKVKGKILALNLNFYSFVT